MIVIGITKPETFREYGTNGLTVMAKEPGWLHAAAFCLSRMTQEELERFRRVVNNPLTVAKDAEAGAMEGRTNG